LIRTNSRIYNPNLEEADNENSEVEIILEELKAESDRNFKEFSKSEFKEENLLGTTEVNKFSEPNDKEEEFKNFCKEFVSVQNLNLTKDFNEDKVNEPIIPINLTSPPVQKKEIILEFLGNVNQESFVIIDPNSESFCWLSKDFYDTVHLNGGISIQKESQEKENSEEIILKELKAEVKLSKQFESVIQSDKQIQKKDSTFKIVCSTITQAEFEIEKNLANSVEDSEVEKEFDFINNKTKNFPAVLRLKMLEKKPAYFEIFKSILIIVLFCILISDKIKF
jgi:hypothetical protein